MSLDYAYKYGEDLIRVDTSVPQTGLDVTNLWNKINGSIEYGITDRFTIGAGIPLSFNAREEGYKKNYYTGSGPGDITLRGAYWLKKYDSRGWNFYVMPSLSIPSGSDAERDADGGWKKPYIVPSSGQWSPGLTAGFQKGYLMDQGTAKIHISANIGRLWTLGRNDAGYDSADAWYGSAGLNYIPGHFGEESERYFGFGVYLTEVRIAGWDTRNGVTVGNTGGKWVDINPAVYFTPDNGKFTASFSVAHPVYIKVHSLQTTQNLSYSFGLAYRF